MIPILAAAAAMQTAQCNVVDNVGRVSPYAIEAGMIDDRPAMKMRTIDGNVPIPITNVTPDLPNNPMATLKFEAAIAGSIYTGKFRRTDIHEGQRKWNLLLTGKDGPRRGLTLMMGICGDGFRPARSGEQPESKGHALTCYAVTVSGRMFSFTYDFQGGGHGIMTASDKTLWQSGSAEVDASGPRSPTIDGIFMDFAAFNPASRTKGPVGVKILLWNPETSLTSYEFTFFDIDSNDPKNSMGNPATALCRELQLIRKST